MVRFNECLFFFWKYFLPLQRGSNRHRRQGFDCGLCTFRHILSTFTFYTITIFSCTKAITVSNIEDKMSLNVKPIDIDRPLVAGWQYKKNALLIFLSLVLINKLIVNCNDCDEGFLCFTITSEVEQES